MSNIRQWLVGLGFGQFADAFEQNRIDLDIARDLADYAACFIPIVPSAAR